MTELRFDGRVAVITGGGRGLGRAYALLLAARGCKVLVNDLGSAVGGDGADTSVAQQLVDEIVAAGGEAIANGDSVATPQGAEAIVAAARDAWGKVDIKTSAPSSTST
jgi:NAD(P)-dependent dehydrogenase (short-subunit alcohol dehydrogenase family)